VNGTFHFAHPWLLLLLIPVAGLIVWRGIAARRRPTLKISAVGPLQFVPRTFWSRTLWIPPTLGAVGLLAATVSLARPQAHLPNQRDVSVEGIDIAIALDLSGSMQAADFKPNNRLFVAKEVLKEFVTSRSSDRIGLVVFAAEAFTQCPLTLDHAVLLNIIDQMKTGVVKDGTAIGNGIATAVNRLRTSTAKSRVVILITDGDNNAGNVSPLQAAQMAKDLGVRVYTILVGKGGKVPFPAQDAFGRQGYQMVEVATNPDLLKQIANKADGAFYLATDRDSLRMSLQEILDALEKTRMFDASAVSREDELAAFFLLPGAALMLLDLLLRATRYRRFP
jgi:Ca-activated chloride channel family protein